MEIKKQNQKHILVNRLQICNSSSTVNQKFTKFINKFVIVGNNYKQDSHKIEKILQSMVSLQSKIQQLIQIILSQDQPVPQQINITYIPQTLLILQGIINKVNFQCKHQIIVETSKMVSIEMQWDSILSYDGINKKGSEQNLIFNSIVQYRNIDLKKNLHLNIKSLETKILLGQAIVERMNKSNSKIIKRTINLLYPLIYILVKRKIPEKNRMFYSNLCVKKLRNIWNMPEEGLISYFLKAVMPSIYYDKKIYIQYQNMISQQLIIQLNYNNSINTCDPISLKYITANSSFKRKNEMDIQIRVLSNQNLEKKQNYNIPHKKIIIQVPGGGFVAQSSYSHQIYTRKWAGKLDIPIFCIDYKKAPQHKYPISLSQVLEGYYWIINQGKTIYNIDIEEIILVGDSAGANLAVSLVTLLIKQKQKLPKCIVIYYPALDLRFNIFSPSLFLSINDIFLNHLILLVCIRSYVDEKKFDQSKDPLISPMILCDQITKKFPQTLIISGTKDPLYDHASEFAVKLKKCNVKVELIIYNGLPHSFLCFDIPNGLRQSAVCVNDSIIFLKERIQEMNN